MKRRIISIVLAMVVCLALAPFAAAEDAAEDVERGVASFDVFIDPQYEDAGFFSEGLVAVKQDDKWGYIDLANKVVIPFEYDYASYFSEGYAIVGKIEAVTIEDWVWEDMVQDWVYIEEERGVLNLGFIDKSGTYKPFRYLDADWQSGEVVQQDLRFDSEMLDYSNMFYFHGGWASINFIVFNTDGNQFRTLDDSRYRAVRVPTQGLVAARDAMDESGQVYLDMNGNIVLDLMGYRLYDADNVLMDEYDEELTRYERFTFEAFPFNQGLAYVVEYTYDIHTGEESILGGFIDMHGRWAIEPQFEGFNFLLTDSNGEFRFFNDGGLASIGKDGAFGAIDRTGASVVAHVYEELWPFSEGLAAFMQDGLYGYIDTSGNVAIPARFLAAAAFEGGFALVHDGRGAMLIDRNGEAISVTHGIDLSLYYDVYAEGFVVAQSPGEYVTIEEDGLYGFGRLSYQPPLPSQSDMDAWALDEVTEAIEEDLVPASLQNMYRSAITRNDFCKLIIHALTTVLETDRDDLVLERTGRSLDSWVNDWKFNDTTNRDVIAAEALNLVTGYDEGDGTFSFRPHNSISRQEAAVMLWRAARELGMDTVTPPSASDFRDRGDLASWAVTQVDFLHSIGIMHGSGGSFNPFGDYSRQQALVTVHRLIMAE